MIRWIYYPNSTKLPGHLENIIKVFEKNEHTISSDSSQLVSDAVLATSNSVDRLDRENKEKEKQELALIKKCEELKKKLEKLTISFKVKTGEQDRVFGSISTKQIKQELKKSNNN